MTDTAKLLLADHLKTLKLPTVLREFDKVAQQCAAEGLDHVQFLARLVDQGTINREQRMIERRIKAPSSPRSKAWTASTSRRSAASLGVAEGRAQKVFRSGATEFLLMSVAGSRCRGRVVRERFFTSRLWVASYDELNAWAARPVRYLR